ncbi:MAG: glycoside hydrolase 43 family protein [Bryobacteraceae bacterium]|nr:glycoside hydrolase 43 family protein [Bryobacteraceae bacterium]
MPSQRLTLLLPLLCALAVPRPVPAAPRPAPAQATFQNPVIWEDLADVDIFRAGDYFYLSASTMHYSPGAPILRSTDLVHWEYAGHSVPVLDFSPAYDLNGGRAYVKGIWASFLNYRKSNKTFYWGGCIEFSKTYIYTAPAVEGPWTKHPAINNCYYDAGLLIDDDDTLYVAHGNTTISVAQLSPDGLTEVKDQVVFKSPADIGYIEGSRFYKINGNYYIFVTHPADGQYILKSTSGPFGPYTAHLLLSKIGSPVAGAGVPHQGGLVQTRSGDWYYMAFIDAYPGGRMPSLAPVHWDADGWPVLELVNGAWGASYPVPAQSGRRKLQVKPFTGIDTFRGKALGVEWEWNHNPDNTKWSVDNGLTLRTATVTNDLYMARNTLTHRILGPASTATISLDCSKMADGDRAGLAMLRDSSAWIGVQRDAGASKLVMVNNLILSGRGWNTTATGTVVAEAELPATRLWLRVAADIHPGPGRLADFSYSTDGKTFTPFGKPLTLNNNWPFFMGYRFAIFNYATQALGGEIHVGSFEMSAPRP